MKRERKFWNFQKKFNVFLIIFLNFFGRNKYDTHMKKLVTLGLNGTFCATCTVDSYPNNLSFSFGFLLEIFC